MYITFLPISTLKINHYNPTRTCCSDQNYRILCPFLRLSICIMPLSVVTKNKQAYNITRHVLGSKNFEYCVA